MVANVYPYQMTQKAHIEVYYGNTLGNAQANGCLYTLDYSVQDYFTGRIKNSTNEKMKALARAGLDYGANCQLYFKDATYSIDGVTYSYITDADHLANAEFNPDNTINAEQPVNYSSSVAGSVEGFTFKGASLILGTEVSMKIYFNWSGDTSDLSVSAVNNSTDEVKSVNILNMDGGKYTGAFSIDGIKSYELSDTYTLYVNHNGNTTALTYFPYTYASGKWNSSTNHLADLVRSLVAYGNAADTYFGY